MNINTITKTATVPAIAATQLLQAAKQLIAFLQNTIQLYTYPENHKNHITNPMNKMPTIMIDKIYAISPMFKSLSKQPSLWLSSLFLLLSSI